MNRILPPGRQKEWGKKGKSIERAEKGTKMETEPTTGGLQGRYTTLLVRSAGKKESDNGNQS